MGSMKSNKTQCRMSQYARDIMGLDGLENVRPSVRWHRVYLMIGSNSRLHLRNTPEGTWLYSLQAKCIDKLRLVVNQITGNPLGQDLLRPLEIQTKFSWKRKFPGSPSPVSRAIHECSFITLLSSVSILHIDFLYDMLIFIGLTDNKQRAVRKRKF